MATPADEAHSATVALQLLETGGLGGLDYSSIILTNRAAGIVDTLDPDAVIDQAQIALHWAGGDPVHSRQFELVSFQGEEEAVSQRGIQTMRELVLGASIGERALDRIPDELRRIRRRFDQDTQHKPGVALGTLCRAIGAPLIGVALGVVRTSDKLPEGAQVASLWHPALLSPPGALKIMQNTVRRVIAEEQP